MIDYTEDLKQFIKNNFTPGTPEAHDFATDNSELLGKLWAVFPAKSIGDYELTDVLNQLNYKRTCIDNEFKWLFNHK